MFDGEKSESQPNRKITIFMSLIAVFVLLFIGLWTYSTFQGSVGSSDAEESLVKSCWTYSLAITEINYINQSLNFVLENKKYSGASLSAITVVSGTIQRTSELGTLTPGNKKSVTINEISITNEFYAYPDNCYEQGKIYKI